MIAKKATGEPKGITVKILRCLKPYSFLISLSFILAAVSVVLTLYVPILIGDAIDLIVGQGQVDFPAISRILFRIGIIIGITAITQWFMTVINNRITF